MDRNIEHVATYAGTFGQGTCHMHTAQLVSTGEHVAITTRYDGPHGSIHQVHTAQEVADAAALVNASLRAGLPSSEPNRAALLLWERMSARGATAAPPFLTYDRTSLFQAPVHHVLMIEREDYPAEPLVVGAAVTMADDREAFVVGGVSDRQDCGHGPGITGWLNGVAGHVPVCDLPGVGWLAED